jgi:hypothetical protein
MLILHGEVENGEGLLKACYAQLFSTDLNGKGISPPPGKSFPPYGGKEKSPLLGNRNSPPRGKGISPPGGKWISPLPFFP